MTSCHFSQAIPPIEGRAVAIRACRLIIKSATIKLDDAEVDWGGKQFSQISSGDRNQSLARLARPSMNRRYT